MSSFLVYMYDSELETEVSTLCKSEEELASLLKYMNTERFKIMGDIIHICGECNPNYKSFCKLTWDDLEFGK